MLNKTEKTREKLNLTQMSNDLELDIWMKGGYNCLTREYEQRLKPELWEEFRIRLQRLYRQATGEEFAVIKIVNGETEDVESTPKNSS